MLLHYYCSNLQAGSCFESGGHMSPLTAETGDINHGYNNSELFSLIVRITFELKNTIPVNSVCTRFSNIVDEILMGRFLLTESSS